MSRAREERPEQLRREYEDAGRATHYREDRWTRSARARRTDAKEKAIVGRFLREAAPLARILDLPCGTGRFRALLGEHAPELWSMDAAREMLSAAPPAHGLQGSAAAIPLQDASVDFILCSRLLHHFEHPEQRLTVLRELARVSHRWIVLSYFDAANFQAWRNRLRGKFRGRFPISRSTFDEEIAAVGLQERERCYIQRGISEQVWVLLERPDAFLARSRTVAVVRRRGKGGQEVVEKTYRFPTFRDRFRGALRGTLLGKDKASRELANLQYLAEAGIPVVEPLACTKVRDRLGFVRWCRLTTRAYAARDLATVLGSGEEDGTEVSEEVWRAIGTSLRRMHDAGIWHRGASARNVLILEEPPFHRWLDPTKSLTYPAGGIPDPARAHDLLRFWTPLEGKVPEAWRCAFSEGYGTPEAQDLAALWDLIPPWKKASTRREMRREEARFSSGGS